MREQWLLKQRKRDEIENLKEELNIDLLTSILLVNRNIKEKKMHVNFYLVELKI